MFDFKMTDERIAIGVRNVELAKQWARNGGLPVMFAEAETKNDDDFGKKLSAAVDRIRASRRRHKTEVSSESDDEGFAQTLARVTRARANGIRLCRGA